MTLKKGYTKSYNAKAELYVNCSFL
uniref:Uncharacterized protein n=1 Tax=Rhizophora mucronata TaxID=61149 RepID=A0A2P2P9S7_RHIMU